MTTWTLLPLDCRQAMRLCMAPNSVDSIVCDPPYDLTSIVKRFGSPTAAPAQFGTDGAYRRASRGFMGQRWDGAGVAFDPDTWREAYRVLKPGGHLLAFGGTRTYHRMVCAIEDAGFEIRDTIAWLYGSGFPKSHDVSKAIDRMAGAEREVVGINPNARTVATSFKNDGRTTITPLDDNRITAPATPEAVEWQGWGTSLKPAHEPIVVARKPLADADGRTCSVAANVLAWGTGGLNIDGCRVGCAPGDYSSGGQNNTVAFRTSPVDDSPRTEQHWAGRFPANVCHDGSNEVLAGFPQSSSGSGRRPVGAAAPTFSTVTNGPPDTGDGFPAYPDAGVGSAARFFYCAKASKADRDEGCDGLALTVADTAHKIPRSELDEDRRAGTVPRLNNHPTVKPVALMRWLVRLVTPRGGLVLDPFAGSGSTGKAALLEDCSFIGCEMTPEYIPIAEARLAHALATYLAAPPVGLTASSHSVIPSE